MPRAEPRNAGDTPSSGPPPRGLAARLMRAMSAQMATQGLRIVQQILLLPLFLKAWGIDIYTDWLVINAAVSLAGVFDAGMQPYFSGLLQERLVRGDVFGYTRAAKIAAFNYLIVILIAIFTVGLASLVINWRDLLGIRTIGSHSAFITLILLGTNALIMLPFGVAGSIYKANSEYDRGVMFNFGNLAFQIAIPGILLILKQPITILATGTFFASAAGWIAQSIDQRLRYKYIPWGLTIPSTTELRITVTQCLFFAAQPVATWLTIQGPVLVLAHLGAPGATVVFTTARTLVGLSRQVTLQMAYPFGFELSVLMLRDEVAAFRRLLRYAASIIGIIGGMLSGLIAVAGPPIALLWLHGRVIPEPSVFIVLALPVAIGASAQIYQLVLTFSNRPRLIAYSVITHAVIGLLLASILAPRFGVTGAAAGLGIGEIIAMVIYLPSRALRIINISAGRFQRVSLLYTALATTLSYVIARTAIWIISPTTTLKLIAFGIFWAGLYCIFGFFFLLAPSQRTLARALLRVNK